MYTAMMQDRKGEENRCVARSHMIRTGFKEGDNTTINLSEQRNAWQWASPAATVAATSSEPGTPASTTSHGIYTDVPPLSSRSQESSMANKTEGQISHSAESVGRVKHTLAVSGSQVQCEELTLIRTVEVAGHDGTPNTFSRTKDEWNGRGNIPAYGVPGDCVTSARAQYGVVAAELKCPVVHSKIALPGVRGEAPIRTAPDNSKRIERLATVPGAGVEELIKAEESTPSTEGEERHVAAMYFERVSAGPSVSLKSQERMASVDWKPAMGGVQRSLGIFNRVPAWIRSAARLDQNADKRGDTRETSPTNMPRKPTRATKKSPATARKRSSKKGLARECMQSFHPSSALNLRETLERTTGTVAFAQKTSNSSAEDIFPLKDKKLESPPSYIALKRRRIPKDIVEDAGRMAEAVQTQAPPPIGIDCLLAEVEGVCEGARDLTWTTAAGERVDEHLDICETWKSAHMQVRNEGDKHEQGDDWTTSENSLKRGHADEVDFPGSGSRSKRARYHDGPSSTIDVLPLVV